MFFAVPQENFRKLWGKGLDSQTAKKNWKCFYF